MKSYNYRKMIVIGNVLFLAICLAASGLQLLKTLDNALFSFDMVNSMTHEPHEDIIVIGIDDESLRQIGRFPWDRRVFADLFAILNEPESKPKVIVSDILFNEQSNSGSDAALAQELDKHDNIVLPVQAIMENDLTRHTKGKRSELLKASGLNKPLPDFADAAQLGHVNAIIDPDGVIRNTWLMLDTPEGPVPSVAYKAAELAGVDTSVFLQDNPQAELTINYQALSYDFMTVSFASVLNREIPLENFKDRIVLIGFTAVGFEHDNGITTVEKEMKLVYAHANIIHQLLGGEKVSFPAWWAKIALFFLVFIIAVYISWRMRTTVSVVLLFAAAAGLLALQFFVFSRYDVYIGTVDPLFTLFLTFLGNVAIRSFKENNQKQFITKQFGRYISPELVSQIAKSDMEIQLGGIEKELSVLFLDIRGFTTLSEKLKPEEVVDFLNMMFNMITNKALDNHGTIDKFIGDAAMILFNAPLDVPNHAYYAVKTAWDIQEGMKAVREQIRDKYDVEINVGIGINTGNVVVGNIGSYLRVDYTAIGDNVNTAARIESNTSANQILVSEATYERTKQSVVYSYVGEKMVKGKTVPLQLYEVAGLSKKDDKEERHQSA